MSDIPRVCATCKFFRFTPAEGDWSDVTPGSDVAISCQRGKWRVDVYDETEEGYRQKMLAAVTCDQYRLVEIVPLQIPPSPPMPASLDDLKALYPEFTMHCGCVGPRGVHRRYAAWYAMGDNYKTQSASFPDRDDAMRWLVDMLDRAQKAVEARRAVETN